MERKRKNTNILSNAHIMLAVSLALVITGASTAVQATDRITADVKLVPSGQALSDTPNRRFLLTIPLGECSEADVRRDS